MSDDIRKMMPIWELEYIKTVYKPDKESYIRKYDHPDNPFIAKARQDIRRMESAEWDAHIKEAKKGASESAIFDDKGIKSSFILKAVAACVVIGIGISVFEWIGNYKSSGPEPWPQPQPVPQPVPQPDPDPLPDPFPTPDPVPVPVPVPGPVPYPVPTPVPEPVQPDINRYEQLYKDQYAEMERQAERDYNSLTVIGARYTDYGQRAGATGRDDPHVAYQLSQFRQLQRRMRDLRFEASKQGVNINQSSWETVNISI